MTVQARLFTTALLLALLLYPSWSEAQAPRRIVVKDMVELVGLPRAEVRQLQDNLRSGLVSVWDAYSILTQADIEHLVSAQELQEKCTTIMCITAFGRKVNAHIVVASHIEKKGSRLVLTVSVIDIASKDVITSRSITGESFDELATMLQIEAKHIFERLHLFTSDHASYRRTPEPDTSGDSAVRRVYLQSTPRGAVVLHDDRHICDTPCALDLPLGNYSLSWNLPHHESHVETLYVDHTTSTIHRQLRPMVGWLTIYSSPNDLQVSIDDQDTIVTPVTELERPEGPVVIRVKDPRYVEVVTRVNIERGVNRHVYLSPALRGGRLIAYARDSEGKDVAMPVNIDGKDMGVTPWSGELDTGEYDVVVGSSYHQVKIEEGKNSTVATTAPAYLTNPTLTDGEDDYTYDRLGLSRAIHRYMTDITECYTHALTRGEAQKRGVIYIEMSIAHTDGRGKVESTRVVGNEIGQSVSDCITKIIEEAHGIPAPVSQATKVSLPFTFSSSNARTTQARSPNDD